jgi:hypothetical protein
MALAVLACSTSFAATCPSSSAIATSQFNTADSLQNDIWMFSTGGIYNDTSWHTYYLTDAIKGETSPTQALNRGQAMFSSLSLAEAEDINALGEDDDADKDVSKLCIYSQDQTGEDHHLVMSLHLGTMDGDDNDDNANALAKSYAHRYFKF